jgi:hypothetical protein
MEKSASSVADYRFAFRRLFCISRSRISQKAPFVDSNRGSFLLVATSRRDAEKLDLFSQRAKLNRRHSNVENAHRHVDTTHGMTLITGNEPGISSNNDRVTGKSDGEQKLHAPFDA